MGDDQVKHIELARHLARSFNSKFGMLFPEPKAVVGKLLFSHLCVFIIFIRKYKRLTCTSETYLHIMTLSLHFLQSNSVTLNLLRKYFGGDSLTLVICNSIPGTQEQWNNGPHHDCLIPKHFCFDECLDFTPRMVHYHMKNCSEQNSSMDI